MRRELTGKRRKRKSQRRRSVQGRKLSRRPRAQRQVRAPRTTKQFFAMSKQAQDEYVKATSVASEARATLRSPRKIAKRLGIDFEKVLRRAGRAFRKRRNGRIVVRPTDTLLRVLIIPTRKGLREIATRDSRQASVVARYWIALNRYLTFGDASALHEFDGKKITTADGKKVPLLTDVTELDRLASAGVLSFETIYAKR
jgi:hypothetical protein